MPIRRFPRPLLAALALAAVPAPALAQLNHHHAKRKHHKHHVIAVVKPTAPKHRINHRHTRSAGKSALLVQSATGSSTTVKSNAAAAGDPGVSILDYKFVPPSITIHVGDTVTWTNNGNQPHTATANNGSFDTGTLKHGQSGSHTFSQAGTFAYICSIHPFMHGTIVVQGNASGSSSGGNGSGGNGGSGGSGGSGGGNGGTGGALNQSGTSDSSPSSTTNSTSSSKSLPNTGLDLGAAVLLGLGMIGTGLVIRRRVHHG